MQKMKIIVTAALSVVSLTLTACDMPFLEKSDESQNVVSSSISEAASSQAADIPKLSFAEIEELAATASYTVHWHSKDGDFDSGTAFVLESAAHSQKLLVTAVHYLWPEEDNGFTGADIPNYVTGGDIRYVKTFESTGASLKNGLVIKDAEPVPAIDKDVAAFTVYGGEKLHSLKLSTHSVMNGDKLYLLANLWDTDDVHPDCVYEGVAVADQEGELVLRPDPRWGCMGASGGPIVNEYGEVVGILMAGDGTYIYAHSSDSFLKQIEAAAISDTIYPEEAAAAAATQS